MAQESKQSCTATNTMQKGRYPGLRDTRQHLDDSILIPTGASHKHLHINPIKEKRKGVATSLLRVDPQHDCLAPLVPRASRASRLAPLEHVRLASNVRFSARLAPRQHVFSQAASALFPHSTLVRAFQARLIASSFLPLRLHTELSLSRVPLEHVRLTHTSTQTCFLSTRPSTTCPALFWARCNRVRQSGEDTPPLPLPLLASETGR